MHYAIIAAGEGSRLVSEGVSTPKPLIKINGVTMIERLMAIFAENNAESINVIVNEEMTEVQLFLRQWATADNLKRLGIGHFNLVVESTPSSMHSFFCLSKVINADYICLTTVDTIFKASDFAKFIGSTGNGDGLFAVTSYIDDEKPLYVKTNGSQIIGFHDEPLSNLVSGGIYCMDTRKAFPILVKCIEEGRSKMRNFQRALLESGMTIVPYVFETILDIDHVIDISKAEQFLSTENV